MAEAASMFCVHKRLRTSCPECKPPPPPPKPKPERAAKRDAVARAERGEPADVSVAEYKALTPAKRAALTPDPKARYRRVKPPTREEAERAQAWWVQKKK
ncbi:MAG: hypothetical protein ACYDCK_04360 [Thermoplasmatota archaeon]